MLTEDISELFLIDCPIGYFGNNCSSPCRYPNYGKECQHNCSHCGNETCNSTFGCPTTGTITSIGTLELCVMDGTVYILKYALYIQS